MVFDTKCEEKHFRWLDLDKTIIKLQKEKYQVEKLKNVLTSQKEKSEIKVENIEKQQQELQNKLLIQFII